jgi:hypothetical protein
MAHLVGIGLYRNSSQVVALDEEGERVFSRKLSNCPQVIVDVLSRLREPHVAVEATYGWEWLIELLEDHGIAHTLSHPTATKAIAAARVRTDRGRRDHPRATRPRRHVAGGGHRLRRDP